MTNPTINIKGLEIEIVPDEEIIASKAVLMCVPAKLARSEGCVPGTKAGYPCTICGQDCVLAPSGQTIEARKQNPIVCMDCVIRGLPEEN